MPDLVRAGLSRPDTVAVDLPLRPRARDRSLSDQVIRGALARPAFGVDPGVNNQAHRTEKHRLQIADSPEWVVVVHAELVSELLGVKRPALCVRGEKARHLAQPWNVFRFQLDRDLPLVSRERFV